MIPAPVVFYGETLTVGVEFGKTQLGVKRTHGSFTGRHCASDVSPDCFSAEKRKRIIDTKRLKWYDTKRCNKQKPSVSHPPPFVAVGRSDMKITTRAFLRGELFCAVNGWMSPVFLLGKIDGGDNDQQGIAR